MRTKGYKCFNVKCGSCVGHSLCGEPADTALGCANRMVSTTINADRIRAMSDEELEDGIRKIAVGYEPWCDHHCNMNGDDNCNSCLTKWLKHPVE